MINKICHMKAVNIHMYVKDCSALCMTSSIAINNKKHANTFCTASTGHRQKETLLDCLNTKHIIPQ